MILVAEHLRGGGNDLADDLSRNRRSSFLSKAPDIGKEHSQAPPNLPELLLEIGDRTSPAWIMMFVSSLYTA